VARLHGLVLSGGRSRRMGADKALLTQDGETQLERMARLLDAVCDGVYVSVRADQQDDPERARFPMIVDAFDDLGPIAGILSAMQAHPGADWLVVACDLPNVSAETLSTLVDARDSGSMVAFASEHNGLPEPLCAIWSANSRPLIEDFVDEGIKCPRKMMIRGDAVLLDAPGQGALDNMNTPDDLKRSRLVAQT